jgi:hypothetical protein
MAWISKRRSQWMGKNGIRASYSNYGYARVPTDQESVDVEYPSTVSLLFFEFFSFSTYVNKPMFVIKHSLIVF